MPAWGFDVAERVVDVELQLTDVEMPILDQIEQLAPPFQLFFLKPPRNLVAKTEAHWVEKSWQIFS